MTDKASKFAIQPSTDAENEAIHQSLRAYNRRFMRDFKDYNYHIEADGEIVAGIVARSTFDTLEVEFLFVEQAHRGRGLGRDLLRHVESLAARDGRKRVLLNTYSFQAPSFYEKLGYRRLCAIEPCFGAFGQYFYGKRLDADETEAHMRISIFLDHLYQIAEQTNGTLAEAMAEAKALGVDFVEADARFVREHAEELLPQMNDAGLRFGSLYAFFDFGHLPQEDERRAAADIASRVGAPSLMAIPGYVNEGDDFEATRERMAAGLDALCDLADARGLRVTMEDFGLGNAPYNASKDLAWFFQRVPRLGFTLDTGNFLCCGEDVLPAYERLKDRVVHVHMKDHSLASIGGEEADTLFEGQTYYPAPIGGGMLPLAEIVRRLQARGYDGIYAIEHFGALDMCSFMRQSVEWIQKTLRAANA